MLIIGIKFLTPDSIGIEKIGMEQSFPSPSFRDPIPSLRPKASGFRVESETETKTALNFEANSETETSPEPRVSVFRVRVSLLHHKKGIFFAKILLFFPFPTRFRFRVRDES